MRYLAIIAVALFCSGYWLCTLVFPGQDNLINWWDMRLAIYSIIFAICFFVGWRLTKGVTKAIFLVGVVFCLGDIVDRYFFRVDTFEFDDLLLYAFALYYIYSAYVREIKTNTR